MGTESEIRHRNPPEVALGSGRSADLLLVHPIPSLEMTNGFVVQTE